MREFIEDNCVAGTIITSRNFQEAFRLQEGESNYAILAGYIETNQQQIDMIAKFCGKAAGQAVVNKMRQESYHDPKNGKVKNWINRNFYQSPIETENRHYKEKTMGVVTSIATELAIKQVAKGIYYYSAKRENYKALEQAYSFLYNYALTDADISNHERVQLELTKIRNGLPLSDTKKKKLSEKNQGKVALDWENIPSISALNNNSQLCEALAYQLLVLYCQKFGDEEGILEKELEKSNCNYIGMKRLLSYYDYLGFTGNRAKEMIRINANKYNKICRDQIYYLQLGRMIIREFSLNIPGIDIHRIQEHCNRMMQYDPYQLRRRTVQNVGVGAAKGLVGLLARRPDIVLNGGALALSQFRLEDGDILTIMEKEFKKNNIQPDVFDSMVRQAKNITEKCEIGI